MDDAALAFLKELVTTPGVSGYEQPVQKVVQKYAKPFADEIESDLHGNVYSKEKCYSTYSRDVCRSL